MKDYIGFFLILGIIISISCDNNDTGPGSSGLIEATSMVISAETAGQVESLFCREGDHLEYGDTIAMIDTVTVALRLDQARATGNAAEVQVENAALALEQARLARELAETEFGRVASLIESGSVNQQQYDRAKNGLDQARLAGRQAAASLKAARADLARIESEIELLKQGLADCFPTAPSSGVVLEKYIEPGELAGPGKSLIKLARLDTVWVKVYLPPADLTEIKLNDPAEVDPENGRGTLLTGRVAWISSEAEFTPKNVQTKEARADLVYAVKIFIPNGDRILKVGMPVSVRIK